VKTSNIFIVFKNTWDKMLIVSLHGYAYTASMRIPRFYRSSFIDADLPESPSLCPMTLMSRQFKKAAVYGPF